MDINQIIQIIKLKRTHGIHKRVAEKTGVSLPTVRKYLNGEVVNPKALEVLQAALEDVQNAG